MTEEWKDIENYEGYYQVSNLGRVKSLDRYVNSAVSDSGKRLVKGRILKYTIRSGYQVLNLIKENKRESFQIHRLVLQAFMPTSDKSLVVNHKDFNRTNNVITNLEWCTPKYNIQHSSIKMKVPKNCVKTNTGEKYISYKKRGSIKNGKSYYYMYYCLNLPNSKSYKTFKTLEEAVKHRDVCLKSKR